MENDNVLLLQPQSVRLPWYKKNKIICPLLCIVGICCLAVAIAVCVYKNAYEEPIALNILSMNCWGVPHAYGSQDKEVRMKHIGEMVEKKEHDLYLFQELWMRPDHAVIQQHANKSGYHMTEVGDLALPNWCDGRATPMYCSGLAIASKYPIIEKEFRVFSVHGDYLWKDGEAYARKGVGRIRISPARNTTIDVFVTHTAAGDDNAYYRQIQTKEIVDFVTSSTADFSFIGGDFNIDPRMDKETTFITLTTALKSAMLDFFGYLEEVLNPKRATYGNPDNTYSNTSETGPQLYDYIFHRSKGWNLFTTNLFNVPILKTLLIRDVDSAAPSNSTVDATKNENNDANGHSVEKRSIKEDMISLSDHEAITSNVLLFKYRWQ